MPQAHRLVEALKKCLKSRADMTYAEPGATASPVRGERETPVLAGRFTLARIDEILQVLEMDLRGTRAHGAPAGRAGRPS